jgi:hypothetical protein
MKKTLLLLLATLFVASSALASVSFSGAAIRTANDDQGNALSLSSTVSFFTIGALDLTSQDIFDQYTATVYGTSQYTGNAFTQSAPHLSGVNLAEGTAFAAVLVDSSTGLGHLFTNSGWVAPADGSTITPGTTVGNAQLSQVVPEPSTYALIAGFAAFLFVAIRRRK